MEGDEYLERIVAASYAKEIDQEENIFRTLPFAATALAVIFTFIVLIKSDVPDKITGAYAIMIWVMLCLFWIMVASSLGFLWLAIKAKPLQYLSDPSALYRYVADSRNFYKTSGAPPDLVEQLITNDTRSLIVEQYVLGATHNQAINEQRLRARSRAFQSLIGAVTLALATVVVISIHKLARGRGNGAIAIQGWN